jgi:uncharacterized repeat protein (TIGR02543 family)
MKTKKWSRVLSLLLVLCFVFSSTSVTALAAEDETPESEETDYSSLWTGGTELISGDVTYEANTIGDWTLSEENIDDAANKVLTSPGAKNTAATFTMTFTLQATAKLSFKYKVSKTNNTTFSVKADGATITTSKSTDYQEAFVVLSAGEHTVVWSIKGNSSNARTATIYDFKLEGATMYNFAVSESDGDGTGTVQLGGKTINLPYNISAESGTTYTLKAVPADDSTFAGWYYGDSVSENAEITITLTENLTYKAMFTKKATGALSVNVLGDGVTSTVGYTYGNTKGTVSADMSDLPVGEYTLKANTASGEKFIGWFINAEDTEAISTEETYTASVETGVTTVYAKFAINYVEGASLASGFTAITEVNNSWAADGDGVLKSAVLGTQNATSVLYIDFTSTEGQALSFDYLVSGGNNNDSLTVKLDGTTVVTQKGSTSVTYENFDKESAATYENPSLEAGTHRLTFTVIKDSRASVAAINAWVGNISFGSSISLTVNKTGVEIGGSVAVNGKSVGFSDNSAVVSVIPGEQTFTATNDDYAVFVGWYDTEGNLLNEDATYTTAVSADYTVVAKFKETEKHNLTVNFTGTAGTVKYSKTNSGWNGAAAVTSGEAVRLPENSYYLRATLTDKENYTFAGFFDAEGNKLEYETSKSNYTLTDPIALNTDIVIEARYYSDSIDGLVTKNLVEDATITIANDSNKVTDGDGNNYEGYLNWTVDSELSSKFGQTVYSSYSFKEDSNNWSGYASAMTATVTAPAGGLYLAYDSAWSSYSNDVTYTCGNNRFTVLLDNQAGEQEYSESYQIRTRAGNNLVTDKNDLPWYRDYIFIPEGTHTVTFLLANAYWGGSSMRDGLSEAWIKNIQLLPTTTAREGKLTINFDSRLGSVQYLIAGSASELYGVTYANSNDIDCTNIDSKKLLTAKPGQTIEYPIGTKVYLLATANSSNVADVYGFCFDGGDVVQKNEFGDCIVLVGENNSVEVQFASDVWVEVENTEDLTFGTGTLTTKANRPWTVVEKDGEAALVSGNKGVGNSVSVLTVPITASGKLTFEYLVSSEYNSATGSHNWDFMLYSLNSEITNDNTSWHECINWDNFSDYGGHMDAWQTVSVYVTEGDTLYIAYRKDGGDLYDVGEDCVWVRNIRVASGNAKVEVVSSQPEYGTASGGQDTVAIGTNITVTAIAENGGQFYGWVNGEGKIVSYDKTYRFQVKNDVSLTAVFAAEGTYVAHNDGTFYTSLAEALQRSESGFVVLLQSVTLDADLAVPTGVTLVVPCMDNDTGYVMSDGVYGNPDNNTMVWSANEYCVLTVPTGKTLTVNGNLMVNAVTGRPAAGHYDQDITGGYGVVALGGSIVINNGGRLDCFGYVTGGGTVTANAGGTVSDLYVVRHWRGGSQAMEMYTYDTYPMNEYDCHNITAKLKINYGATYTGYVKMYASGAYYYTSFPQVDNTNGLIRLTSENGYVIKTYENGREVYTIYGGADFAGSTLNIVGTNLSTSDYIFPVDGDITFNLKNGSYVFKESFKFLTGAAVNVEDGAAVTVAEGASVVFYDKFNDVTNTGSTAYPSREAATLNLNGKGLKGEKFDIQGSFAGTVIVSADSDLITKSDSAKLTVQTTEANGYDNGVVKLTFGTIFTRAEHTDPTWDINTLTWTANQYTITFKNGEQVLNSSLMDYGATITAPKTDIEGYAFKGWDKELSTVKGDETFTGTWTPIDYTITFVTNGGSEVTPITQGYETEVTAQQDPTRDGYSFAGWYDNAELTGDGYTFDTMPLGGTTLYAKWTANTYYVTFENFDSCSSAGKDVTFGSTYGDLPTPSKKGYGFTGWYIGDTKITSDTVVTTAGAHTLTATWSESADTRYYVSHYIEQLDGTFKEYKSQSLTGRTNSDVTAEPIEITGFTWDATRNSAASGKIVPDGSTNLNLYYTRNSYTVTYLDGDKTAAEQQTYKFGETLESPTYSKTGYTFNGWGTVPTTMPAENLTLYAATTPNTYTVTFDAEGVDAKIVTYDAAYGELPTPTRTGYTFGGWTLDGEAVTSESIVRTADDHQLAATWTVNAYTFTFDAAGGSAVAAITQDYGTAVVAPANPTREGYTFAGWSAEIPATMPAADVTITATWTVNAYTVTFDAAGGSAVAAITQDYGTAVEAPANPTREGYTFAGWSAEIPATMPAADVTITATWTVNAYTITFDAAGGSAVAAITQDYGTAVEAPANPTREGYTFAGWSAEIPATMPAEDITITATWTVNAYTITFDAAGGSAVAAITQDYGTAVVAPANPTREGYTFAGWSAEIPATMPAADVTITATWTVNAYTITFDAAGGSAVAAIMQDYGTAVAAPANPTREGYTFAGWSAEIPATMPAADVTITATWTANKYTITYDTAGGGKIDSVTRDYGTSVIAPANPTREGYTFTGWDRTIPTTVQAQDVTITATWRANNYTVVLDKNAESATGEMENIAMTYAQERELPENEFARAGYHFVGWALTADGDAEYDDGATIANLTSEDGTTVTLYAVWEANPVVYTPTKTEPEEVTVNVTKGENGEQAAIEVTIPTTTTTTEKAEKVTVKTDVTATTKTEDAVPVQISAPTGTKVKVELTVQNVSSGVVAVRVLPDGTEEIIKNGVVTENGVQISVEGDTTIKLVDNSKTFDDVKTESVYSEAINFVAARGIMNGNGDGTFAPTSDLSRGMIAQVLFNLESAKKPETSGSFNDVSEGGVFTDAISWAAEQGIVQGYGNGAFGTNDSVTREQLATILYRYAVSADMDTEVEGDLSAFKDGGSVKSYAADAMRWAVSIGLFAGNGNGQLNPGDTASREQIAIILMRFCNYAAAN